MRTLIRSLAAGGEVTNRQVAAITGLSRQAIHYHLRAMVEARELERIGLGRGARYRVAATYDERWPLEDLEEDRVWRTVNERVPGIGEAMKNVRDILGYAMTEMVNNAIDHSGGTEVRLLVQTESRLVAFEVLDDGVGVFRHVRDRFGLPDDPAAIAHLSKGRQTTQPTRHTGEGIFFTSRAVDRFILESGRTLWIVDNRIGDQAVGDGPGRTGTRVRCELAAGSTKELTDVFRPHTDEEGLGFARTSVSLRLFEGGETFLSRSEARRLTAGMESFDQVTIDFTGVSIVGQGFVDELFRVWATANPHIELRPINMSPNVEWMIQRLRRG